MFPVDVFKYWSFTLAFVIPDSLNIVAVVDVPVILVPVYHKLPAVPVWPNVPTICAAVFVGSPLEYVAFSYAHRYLLEDVGALGVVLHVSSIVGAVVLLFNLKYDAIPVILLPATPGFPCAPVLATANG